MSSVLSIHKEIEKKKYAESPLGKVERKLTKIYDALKLSSKQLPEDIAKEIYEIRDDNENWNLITVDKYAKIIQDINEKHRDEVDAKLLEAMSKELDILIKNGYGKDL